MAQRKYILAFITWQLIVCLTIVPTLYAQKSQLQQITLQHDNDFLFAIDRYYTAGTFIAYSRQMGNNLVGSVRENYPLQLELKLGQETYTPRELFETNFDFLERPYAGYLFLSGALSKARKKEVYRVGLEIGVAGEQSLAGEFQVAYHKLINEFIPTWSGEIGNSFHFNTYGEFLKDFSIPNSNLFKNFALRSKIALGTRRIYARQEALLFVGRRQVPGLSAAFGRLDNSQELYGFFGIGGEYVFLNALIEGHPWNTNSPFVLPATHTVLSVRAGGAYRGESNLYTIVYHYRTRETQREGRSQFVSLSFSRRW